MTKIQPTAAYIRVSTQEQKMHGLSLDAQRDKLKEYAKDNNLKIVEWYEDEGVSGRKLIRKRPELQRMINDAQAKKFERIIFIKLDRFFRSVAEYHECMKLIDPVLWTATEEDYDLTTANGRLLVNMKLTIAELEADQTGERIKLVNDYKVKTGQPLCGSIPWSHVIDNGANGKKKIIVNPETRDQAIEVINYFLKTNSLRKTLYFCNQYHSFYDVQGIKRWLSNSLLVGKLRDNENYCEALIDNYTYNEIQKRLENNVTHSLIGEPMFRRLLVCPECGKRLTAVTDTRVIKGKRYRYQKYRCDNHAYKRCSYNKRLSENLIEKCLLENLTELLGNHIINATKVTSRQANDNQSDIDKLTDELERINYMFEKGRMSVVDYDERYDAIQKRIAEIKAPKKAEIDEEKLKQYEVIINGGWREMYDELSLENKGNFWHMIIESMQVSHAYDGSRNYVLDWINFF